MACPINETGKLEEIEESFKNCDNYKSKYKKAALYSHPDKNEGCKDEAENAFKAVGQYLNHCKGEENTWENEKSIFSTLRKKRDMEKNPHQPQEPQFHQPQEPQFHQYQQPHYQPQQPQFHQPQQPQYHQPQEPQYQPQYRGPRLRTYLDKKIYFTKEEIEKEKLRRKEEELRREEEMKRREEQRAERMRKQELERQMRIRMEQEEKELLKLFDENRISVDINERKRHFFNPMNYFDPQNIKIVIEFKGLLLREVNSSELINPINFSIEVSGQTSVGEIKTNILNWFMKAINKSSVKEFVSREWENFALINYQKHGSFLGDYDERDVTLEESETVNYYKLNESSKIELKLMSNPKEVIKKF